MAKSLMPNYNRLPVAFVKGEGVWLWDDQGRRYLDALAGVAVGVLGHAHPAVRDAICEQAGLLIHTSNIYQIIHQQTLADRLTQLSGMDNAFFCNSGAEANEAAIKIARLTGHKRGLELPKIVVMEGAFHGRTMATLSATGNRKVQAGFEPLVQGFVRVPYNDLDTLRKVAKEHRDIVAVLVEPVQGEGGVRIPAPEYLNGLREMCDEHRWLMMVDEIQTGMGRTGRWLAFQHNGIVPDVLTLAKGLGNGVPVGACLARGDAAQCLQPGTHGSTFGGNPLASRAALAVIETIERLNLVERAAQLERLFADGLARELAGVSAVREIRIKGMMIGIELDRPCTTLPAKALEQNLLINVTADSVIRLLPPLIMSDAEANQIISQVAALVKEFAAGATP
jgi:acetylornithine aminotransferase